jgi:hypothetical protein
MKRPLHVYVTALVLLLCSARFAIAQGYGSPLNIQGLDRTTPHSAASRAAGGITIGLPQEIATMFFNPAMLQTLDGPQISLGVLVHSSDAFQTQQYAPAKYYPNFSLVMEGLTGLVPDAQLDTTTTHTAKDSVQRPFDSISPGWSRTSSRTLPVQALAAMPVTIGGVRAAIGIGVVEYANLDSYYQNNNVLSPSINVQRPVPVPLVKNDSLSLPVQWYQYQRKREGSLYGYGAALSFEVTREVSFGVSGMLVRGSSDDYEQTVGRGRLVFYGSYFRLDSVSYGSQTAGSSNYSGQEFTFSAVYRGRYVSAGIAVKPPSTIVRAYSVSLRSDTNAIASATQESGEDRVKLPWRGMAGLSLVIKKDLMIGLECELRSYASAVYTAPDGQESSPWLSATLLRFGLQYAPFSWLALRAGVREEAEVFGPEGNTLSGEPVKYAVYSAGCGLSFSGVRVNLAYEYVNAKYTDMFVNNVNLNGDTRQSVVLDLSYTLPWTANE